MKTIKEIVHSVIENMSLCKPEVQTKIQRIWKNVLNEKEDLHSKIFDFKADILFVNVDSPSWLYQMNLKKKKILECVQEEIPEIKNIQFKIGKVK